MSATSIEARTAQPSGELSPGLNSAELVERARHGAHRPGRDLGVEGGVVQLGVPEQDLDDPDVGAVLQQVGGEAVAQRVRPDPLGDVGGLCRLDDDAMELPRADRLHRVLSGEQPAVAVHHALLPPDLPPLAQQGEQVFGQHGVAIPPALAALDPEQHALAVDVGDLQRRHLGDAQARAIGDRQRGLVLEAGGGVEQPGDLVAAEHHRQLARMRQPDQLARQIRAVERLGEEEAQRRHDAVHGRHGNAVLLLLDLEPAQVVGGRRIRRSPEEACQPSDIAEVVALRLRAENRRMFMSSISRWRSGLIGASGTGWGMVRLLVEEARHALPQPNHAQCSRDGRFVTLYLTAGALPRSGFVRRPPSCQPEMRPQSRRSST